jgi:DNA-directed RNA polymerase subunit RPC12/RpoP
MGIKLDCPTCGKRMTFDMKSSSVLCRDCGFKPMIDIDQRAAEIRAKGQRPNVSIHNEDQIQARAISLFYTAQDYLFDGNKKAAIDSLQDALDIQSDFADAHLWIARISDDEAVKRDHLSSILAVDGSHAEAARMMLILNGRLTSEQAEKGEKSNGPVIKKIGEAVKTTLAGTRCPKCNGSLTTNDVTGRVECGFCGYTADQGERHTANGDSLLAALLERRAQPVKWVIGEHLLHCNNCGAERAIPATELSTRCPFCGSNQVIKQDALNSFDQPDGVIPFKVTREEASRLIKEHLKSISERIKGWFDNNKVASATLNGYYLPFWMFDATVEVTRTRIRNQSSNSKYGYMRNMTPAEAYVQTKYNEIFSDLEVCGAQSPSKELTSGLGDYHTSDLLDYSPNLLAKYPAQLYTQDFDEAALEARSQISAAMRYKFGHRDLMEDEKVTINVFTNIQQMSFRLILAPVWIGHLIEQDKDHRTALVNGQTGQVILGKSEKPQRNHSL